MKKKVLVTLLVVGSLVIKAQTSSVDVFEKSYNYEASADYQKAIDVFSELANTNNSYSVNLRLGWLYYQKGEYLKSKSFYTKATELMPSSIEARLGLIYPLSKVNNWDEVIGVYNEILAIDPNHSYANYQLGYIYYVRKDYEKSFDYVKKVLKLYPFDYDSNLLAGAIALKQGNITLAKKHYTLALEYNPSNSELKKIVEGL